jgi:MFS family permease
MLPYYLGKDALGFSEFGVGIVVTTALVGGISFTLISGILANRIGRRNSLSIFGLLMTVAGLLLFAFTNIYVILLAVFIGMIGVNATETGPSASIEQAIIPQTTSQKNRTYAFSIYNLLGYAGASFGALLARVPTSLHAFLGFNVIDAYKVLFALYAASGLLLTLCYRILSRRAEIDHFGGGLSGLTKSKRTVAKLSALFSIDAFGGGFVQQTLISQWFLAKYNTSLDSASNIFFFAQLITAASFLVAGRLSKRVGLLRTMVLTHFPSNLLLIGVGLVPGFEWAVAFLFARQTLSQMDVPTRQSYMIAIIEPEERNAATSVTNVSRSVAAAVPPPISGYLIGTALLDTIFVFGGTFKIVYDILVYASFRKVKPPEEKVIESKG